MKRSVYRFIQIRPLRAELVHADGQTDMTKLIVTFRNFANAPKMGAAIPPLLPSTFNAVYRLQFHSLQYIPKLHANSSKVKFKRLTTGS